MRVTVLAGGIGGSRFLLGLRELGHDVTVIGNTGDDAVFHGLHVSPDLDIVTYTLGGIVDTDKGWGVAGDTRHALVAPHEDERRLLLFARHRIPSCAERRVQRVPVRARLDGCDAHQSPL